MKQSIYNTNIQATSKSAVIYNALTDNSLIYKSEGVDLADFSTLPKSLYDKLVEGGFLVEDNVDEYKEFIDFALMIEHDDSMFHLLINPTLNCNFNCWYCYETHFNSKMSEDIIDRIYKLINNIYSEGKNLVISFFGGEPLLYYDNVMLPILSYAYKKSQYYKCSFSANMTSNGFLLNKDRIQELVCLGFDCAQITLDGNKEIHNKTRFRFDGDDTFSTIVSNIKLLVKNGISVTLRINSTKENLESLSDIPISFSDLTEEEKKRIHTDLQIVWQENNRNEIYNNLNQTVDIFNKAGIPTAKMDFRNFCYADRRNSCLINYNGDLYKCTAIDFSEVRRDGYLSENGELIWENDSVEKRMASKFNNPHCRTCRIFPLCHGGCTKQSLSSNNYCLNNFNDEEKDNVVINRILLNSTFSKSINHVI